MIDPEAGTRHNSRSCGPLLPLSEVAREPRPDDPANRVASMRRPIGAGGRLTDTARRFEAHRGRLIPAPAFRAERIAATIRADRGDVWGAVLAFGISYAHACRIRAGWRPGGLRAPAIPRLRALAFVLAELDLTAIGGVL